MTVLASYPLFESGPDRMLRPGPQFRRLPAPERQRMARVCLDLFLRLKSAHEAEPTFTAPVPELIAWAAAGEDIHHGVQVWKLELHRATKAMAQGWAAVAPAGGPGCESHQGAKTPYTPTAVSGIL